MGPWANHDPILRLIPPGKYSGSKCIPQILTKYPLCALHRGQPSELKAGDSSPDFLKGLLQGGNKIVVGKLHAAV